MTIQHNKELEDKEKESYEKRKEAARDYAKARKDATRLIQDIELSLQREGIEKELAQNKVNFERLREDLLSNTELTLQERKKLNDLYTLQELQAEQGIRDKFNAEELRGIESKNKAEAEEFAKQIAREDAQFKLLQELRNTNQENEIASVVEKYEQQFDLANGNAELELELQKNLQSQINEINQKYADEELKRIEEEKAARIAAAEEAMNKTNQFAENIFTLSDVLGKKDEKSKEQRAKRQFQINKSMQLAGAVMDGYKAVTASLSQSPVAIGALPNPVGIASLAFAVSTSLANIAKIASTQFQSSGGVPSTGGGGNISSGGGGGNVQTAAPSLSLFGNSRDFNNTQEGQSAESTQVIQVQATVSETEITSTQKKVNKYKENAEL